MDNNDDDAMSRVIAPWTDEQVRQLTARQEDYGLHPYTCGRHSERPLEPTPHGWVCRALHGTGEQCQFTQNWAHASDVAESKGP